MHRAARRAVSIALAGGLVGGVGAVARADEAASRDPHERGPAMLLGAHAGFEYHSGRAVVADVVSGASTDANADTFMGAAFVGGLSADLGIGAGPGNVGLRTFADLATPGPFVEWSVLLRYRLPFVLGTSGVRSVDPWLGAGLGVDYKDVIRDPYVGFPIAAGCDFRLWESTFLTTELDVSAIDPWGPSRTVQTDAGPVEHQGHFNRLAIKVGFASRAF